VRFHAVMPRGSRSPRHRARKPGQTQNDDKRSKRFQTSPTTETLPSTSTDPGETILYERSLPASCSRLASRYGRYERYDHDTYRLFASHLGSVVFAKARTWLESPSRVALHPPRGNTYVGGARGGNRFEGGRRQATGRKRWLAACIVSYRPIWFSTSSLCLDLLPLTPLTCRYSYHLRV
jgi:hypothetical protein